MGEKKNFYEKIENTLHMVTFYIVLYFIILYYIVMFILYAFDLFLYFICICLFLRAFLFWFMNFVMHLFIICILFIFMCICLYIYACMYLFILSVHFYVHFRFSWLHWLINYLTLFMLFNNVFFGGTSCIDQ